ncbi:MAG: HDIG domain-containing protein [Deltaproteobacteria bacterium]|nr:HDIG domain-containing protein [Deltaproteobacteria bacterium]
MRELFAQQRYDHSVWLLVVVCGVLSLLAGSNFERSARVYVAGEVAEHNVVAERDMQVEDSLATQARREQVIAWQPPVFDLNSETSVRLHRAVLHLFMEINATGSEKIAEKKTQLERELAFEISLEQYAEYATPAVQRYVTSHVLPRLESRLNEGVLPQVRPQRMSRAGIVIRNLDTGIPILRSDSSAIPDTASLLADIAAELKADTDLPLKSKKAINDLVGALLVPSLSYNSEATRAQAHAVARAAEPVYYQLRRGEVVARKGDRISREQQLKIQAVYASAKDFLNPKLAGGLFTLSLLLSLGLFVAPGGRVDRPLVRKDVLLMSLLLLISCSGAKALHLLGVHFQDAALLTAFSYAYPVGAASGLVVMVFAARRYYTFGLLSALFCAAMFQGGAALFFFYFVSGMVVTWQVMRSQNRQDVIWSLIPHVLFHLPVWFGATLLAQNAVAGYPGQLVAIVVNSVLTLLLLFAVSPILEIVFGYTTRFRLMELMNLEQPLLQELMVSMPGTYHHSLLVANLVEAGAKVVGANSLLCKVAALYHDIGKIAHPEYFIENQFAGANKHDRLTPSMSALVLISHVKKGVELAEGSRLGQEICSVIREHHGTRLMSYFFHKAVEAGEHPRPEDFSYPGPRPRSKEAAIVMLADVVEASSRVLSDPTPARIAGHIDKILHDIFVEGQLDEADLTFKDVHKLSMSFRRILTGLFHQRIAYPGDREHGEKNGGVRAQKQSKEEAPAGERQFPLDASERSQTS